MEDTTAFYQPLIEWIDKYNENPHEKTTVHLKFEYFNTSASKWIITITKQLSELYKANNEVEIIWYYEDEDMEEYGEVIRDLVEIPFTMIEMEEEDD